MPIAIAVRTQFSDSHFRDVLIRALRSWDIDSIHIASGFFNDFTAELADWAPDFQIDEEMGGKEVFLYGGYHEKADSMCALRDALVKCGINTSANRLRAPRTGEQALRWHAKVSVFVSGERPVLAIVGSSNLTSPTMYGNSEHKFVASPERVNVEADSFYWLRTHADADQAVHDAFHYWGGGRLAPHIAFYDEKFDDEVERLMRPLLKTVLSYPWQRL
ncbi:phospholipase D family protein [Pelomonas cellulosilytica]|uniref:Phospholipase D family protein n=1 Tax=Pelomonas cellulosilytica TaxID=2906762 RepID=A0ABS8XX73_9BURK|nr:phospholipase D family protein [Pelomonas sp. P8]MCE4556402.1 phospholipase D family protein [Pelomonas sp. P8]